MFSFTHNSTVKERILIGELLISQIDAKLDKAIESGKVLSAKRRLIRNKKGKVIVTGNFVDLNSDYMLTHRFTDPENPWMWKGRTFKDEVVSMEGVD